MILKFRSLKEQASVCAKDSDRYAIVRQENGDVKFNFYIPNDHLNVFVGDTLELWIIIGGRKCYGQSEVTGIHIHENEAGIVCKLFEQGFVEEGD